jgi:hypothetical protein
MIATTIINSIRVNPFPLLACGSKRGETALAIRLAGFAIKRKNFKFKFMGGHLSNKEE